jgi:hypothetical protein
MEIRGWGLWLGKEVGLGWKSVLPRDKASACLIAPSLGLGEKLLERPDLFSGSALVKALIPSAAAPEGFTSRGQGGGLTQEILEFE